MRRVTRLHGASRGRGAGPRKTWGMGLDDALQNEYLHRGLLGETPVALRLDTHFEMERTAQARHRGSERIRAGIHEVRMRDTLKFLFVNFLFEIVEIFLVRNSGNLL